MQFLKVLHPLVIRINWLMSLMQSNQIPATSSTEAEIEVAAGAAPEAPAAAPDRG